VAERGRTCVTQYKCQNCVQNFVGSLREDHLQDLGVHVYGRTSWPLRSRDSGYELHSHGSGHVEVANTSGHNSLMNVPEIC
jgi:hypothetical protein